MSLHSVKGNVVGERYIAYGKYFNHITIIQLTGQRWIPLTKASDAEHWCLLWSAPQQTLETQVRDWCGVITNGICKRHLKPFIQAQIRENIKAPCPWPLCGEFTGEFPTQMASNVENISIWWRHHEIQQRLFSVCIIPAVLYNSFQCSL